MMLWDIIPGITVPFLGTALGAGCVFFMRGGLCDGLRSALTGFAAGVMTAASVWSLLLPAMEQASDMGRLAFLPAAAGFWAGVLFLMVLDRIIPRLRACGAEGAGPARLSRTGMLVLAVVLHNVPEGMAVGVAYAGVLSHSGVTAAAALVLAAGIAIQNFPEGAIISLPLRAAGMRTGRAFLLGVLSGAVEPAGAVLVLLAARVLVPVQPYFLSFAAGAMIWVVAEELVPAMHEGERPDLGALPFCGGFTVMMALDVALS